VCGAPARLVYNETHPARFRAYRNPGMNIPPESSNSPGRPVAEHDLAAAQHELRRASERMENML